MWFPADLRCETGGPIEGSGILRPFNTLVRGTSENAERVILTFAVGPEGRPHSIEREGNRFNPAGSNASAALAGSRFPAGSPRQRCQMTYHAKVASFEEAPLGEVVSLSITPDIGRPPQEMWDRINGSRDCMSPPRPQQLVRVMPDFSKIKGKVGARDWTLIGYDIDDSGKTTSPHVVLGTNNAELDAAAVKAIQESRFTEGTAKTGCLFPFWRNPELLEAPAMPDDQSPCDNPAWERAPVLTYPKAFQKRLIEGWAVVRYDIAPWGETGNIEVVEAQPAADFGQAAHAMLRGAKHEPLDEGATGCFARVIYVMPDEKGMPSPTLGRIEG